VDHLSPIPEPAPQEPQPPLAVWIFFGKQGLRAGWGLLIFLFLFFALNSVQRFVVPGTENSAATLRLLSPQRVYAAEGIAFLIVLLVTFVLSRIERRPLRVYGLGSITERAGQFFAGLLWGVVLLSLLIGLLWKFHLLDFNARILSGGNVLRYGAVWLIGFLLVALFEEYFMRGYLLFTLTRGLTSIIEAISSFFTLDLKPTTVTIFAFWISAAILSFLFGAGHSANNGESPIGLLAAGLAGLIFCLVLWRTGSLWWAVGFHCTWDWAQSFLYGVGDSGGFIEGRLFDTSPIGKPIFSGGATGPEGSLLVLPVLALVVLIIFFTLPKQPTPAIAEKDVAA
jgi:membrane protease YdiL (CAAX protease family)